MRSTGTVFAIGIVATTLCAWAGMGGIGIAVDEIRLESTADQSPVLVRRVVSLDDAGLKIRPAAGERGGDGERTISREALISLVFAVPAANSRDRRGTDLLHLTSGDCLRVVSVTSGDDTLSASLAASPATQLTIPLEQTRGLLRLATGQRGTNWSARLPVAEGSADVALLQNADRIRGEFLSLSEESLTIDTDAGETTIAREDVKGIAFSPELLSVRPIPERHAIVQLRDGSYLTVDTVHRGAGETDWRMTVADARWSIPEEALGRIMFYSEAATSLLSLDPADRRTVPFLPDDSGGDRVDPSEAKAPDSATTAPPTSAPPIVRGRPVPRGLEAQGRTEWTYHLKPGWKELRALADVPDAAGEGGSCVLRVEVDGKAIYESPLVRPGPEPVSVPPIPLSGASTLKLVVDYGEFWDVRNRGVWIDPRLVRAPADPRTN